MAGDGALADYMDFHKLPPRGSAIRVAESFANPDAIAL